MYPVYRCMEPFPQPVSHQKNHTPYPHHYNPGWEAIPTQVKIDPTESPHTLKPWPYSGNFAYPNPTECHGYCNHSYLPGYYSYRPPHSYLSPHPPMYYYGPHPPHHDVYSPYFIPPPHYAADQARYEYDKNMVRDHCCGCPNHACNGKADSKVRIEEERPGLERKGSDSNGLAKLQNYPYPIICMPPECIKDKETAKPLESDLKTCNGWVPLDLNSVRSLNKGGDEKRIKDQQTEDKKPQLQWPIIWFPGCDKPEDEKKDVKDIEVSPKVEEDAPQKFKIIPVKLLENENYGEKPGDAEDASGNWLSSAAIEKDIKPRSATTKKGNNTKNIEVKQLEENGEKKSETAAKKPASSPVKTSKLPPVCLRVDPLPKKKNGNGPSRSPSPPAAKERRHQDLKKQELLVDKDNDGRTKNEETKIMNVEEKPSQISEAQERKSRSREIKVVDLEEKTLQTSEARGGLPEEKEMQEVKVEEKMVAQRGSSELQQLMEPVAQESNITTNEDQAQCQVRDSTNLSEEVGPVTKKAGIDGREHENTEEKKEVAEGKKVDKKKAMRKILCNVEAAVLIQSAYRGYEVRRWEPLKKLRQIARICKQVDEIRERIQDIESSAKLQVDEKQQVVLNETIMSLLLQLDTIQGLHPDVREIRKSVARELVCLQEKLDSFATQTVTDLPIEKACRDDEKTTQENGSVIKKSNSKPAETSELFINGDVAPDASQSNEAMRTAMSVEEQHEVKQKEILEMPLVDAEWFESKREEHKNHPTLVEHTRSVTSSEELAEVNTENDGRCTSEVDVLVGSPPSVNVEQLEEDFIDLDTVRDEKEDSAVNDKLVKSLQIDGYLDSIVEKLSKAAPMVAEEEAAPTLQQVPLVKDDQVEELLKLQEANEEAISGPQSPETMLTGDECVNSVVEEVLPDMNRSSEIDVEEVDTMSVVKEEHDSEHVELPLISELSSLAVKEKDAECKPVEEEGSLEDAENQLLYSGSDIDATVKIATPVLADQGNIVEVVSGGNNGSDAEAVVVMAENPIPEEVGECNTDKGISEDDKVESPSQVGECNTDKGISEDDKVESPSQEKGMNPSLDIFEATTISHEIETKSQTLEPDIAVQAISEIESLPPLSTPESDVEQGSNAENDSVSFSCGDPVPPSEVELQKEDKDLVGENDKLKEMLEKLLKAGKQQLTVISNLNGRVMELEKKLAKKKKMKIRRQKAVASSCIMHKDNHVNQRASATSMV